jgi:hypothetical protein
MTSKPYISAAFALGLCAGPAVAHHSFAMFDAGKTIELKGTVKEFRWTNPHSWLFLVVTDAKGVAQEWAMEMGSPVGLVRSGWGPRAVAPGDKLTVKVHPMRDGRSAGQLLTATLPGGRTLGDPSAK